MKVKILISSLVLIIVLLLGYILYSYYFQAADSSKSSEVQGLTQVQGYVHDSPCLAIEPGCGYCPGTILYKQCYVDINKLTDEEKNYLDL